MDGIPVGFHGEVVGYVGTITDISDRKQAELERQQLFLQEPEARKHAESALGNFQDWLILPYSEPGILRT